MPLSLSITSFPTKNTKDQPLPTIFHILRALLPAVSHLPLSLELLNDENLHPVSVQEDLHAGQLQYPSGTLMVITESGINEGTIRERGTLCSECVSSLTFLVL